MDDSIVTNAVYDWHGISTAPRDGTVILVYRAHSGDARARLAYFNENGKWDSAEGTKFSDSHPPTWWRHLPDPPLAIDIFDATA